MNIINNMIKEETYSDLIIAEARKIAESKFPIAITDSVIKEMWISGFISGYLNRTTEEITNNNLKTKN